MEGVSLNEKDNKVYIAIADQSKAMEKEMEKNQQMIFNYQKLKLG